MVVERVNPCVRPLFHLKGRWSALWCSKRDLNPHEIALTRFLVWDVYQFHHSSIEATVGCQPHIFSSYLYCFSEHLLVWSPVSTLKIRWGLCFTTTLTKEDCSYLQGGGILQESVSALSGSPRLFHLLSSKPTSLPSPT